MERGQVMTLPAAMTSDLVLEEGIGKKEEERGNVNKKRDETIWKTNTQTSCVVCLINSTRFIFVC